MSSVLNPGRQVVQLSGRTVEYLTLLQDREIRDSTVVLTPTVDLTPYRRVSAWVKNNHNQPLTIIPMVGMPEGAPIGLGSVAWWDGEENVLADLALHQLTPLSGRWLLLNGVWPELFDLPLARFRFNVQAAAAAPDSGAMSIVILGEPV